MADIANGAALKLGGQDCHMARTGAHTGDISAAMLAEAGASYVIVGHSERRADHGENDAIVRAKAEAALDEGLTPIICIGETLAERDAGQTLQIVTDQLSGSLPAGAQVVVAYEPVWAIGTGKVATPEQIAEVHDALRTQVGATTPLLYGGSVKPGNAAEIFALENVDGALVGGASLKAADFGAIIAALGAA
jgi:triosephosphate isomerase